MKPKFNRGQWVEVYDCKAKKWFAGVVEQLVCSSPRIYRVTGFDAEGMFSNTWDESFIRDRTYSVGA